MSEECIIDGCGHEGKIDGYCAKHYAMQEKSVEKSDKEPSCVKCGKKASAVKKFIKKRGMCESCAYYKKKSPGQNAGNILKPAPKKPILSCRGGAPVPALINGQQEEIINHPAHYTKGKIEVIDFIADQAMGYLDGNIIKYVSRYRHKGTPLEDLKKARWYLDKLIENLEGEK